MRTPRFVSLAAIGLFFSGAAAACGSASHATSGSSGHGGNEFAGSTSSGPGNGSGGGSPSGSGSSSSGFGFDGSAPTLTALSIMPSTATLVVTNPSSPPTETLAAYAIYSDGSSMETSASWSIDRIDIATIAPGSGTVTPTGNVFGTATVSATANGLTAQAQVAVALKTTEDPDGGVSQGDEGLLTSTTTPDPSVTAFAYPYDATVFPRGLLPPEIQWNGGAAGDEYALHFSSTNFDLTVFTTADPPSRFTLSAADWTTLTSSVPGQDVTVQLSRLSAGTAYLSAKETWHIADANLGGSIYYWSISQGQIFQINLGTGSRSAVFDSGSSSVLGTPTPIDSSMPASPPWEDNGSGKRCVACHSVSKDGSTLTSVFSRAGSQGPLGFVNIASAQINAVGDYQTDGAFNALTPNGAQAVVNYEAKTMQLLDTTTGNPIASALDGVADLCDPTFSPDGTLFALAANCDPGFGSPIEFRASALTVYSYANAAPYFSNPITVIQSAGPLDGGAFAGGPGPAIAFPSFSPDSSLLFFQGGSYSRAKYGTPPPYLHGIDDLYVVPAQANATPIALDQANNPNGALPADSQHLNYAPTVNPISAGGYIWVVFTSVRDYGNEMVSPQGAPPNDATYSNHKQLWVTAVDAKVGTVDPSHPPFWLPGQDSTTANMFGYWALSPCKPTATDGGVSSCSAGFDCCSGFCRDLGQGPMCVDNTGGACSQVGEKCSSTGDCCGAGASVSCVGGICQQITPT